MYIVIVLMNLRFYSTVILGHNRNGVLSAKTRVEVLLDSGRQKQPFTHFLSVPLTDKHIQDSLADFKADVLRECDGVSRYSLLDSVRKVLGVEYSGLLVEYRTPNKRSWFETCLAWPQVIKLFSCSTQLRLKFILLINVKMPTIVGILTFISRINYRFW